MTSQERREARYQRRRAKRQAKKQGRSHSLGGLEKTFTYRKMFQWGWKCCKGVNWKQSVQNFRLHLFSGTARRVHFALRERGKVRPIDAPHIVDRQVHKVLCNEVLIPLYKPGMIYDNGASQRMKGLHWAYRRLSDQLRWHFRRYGRSGGIFLLDLKGYFPNAPHAAIYRRHEQLILDPGLRRVADTIIQNSPCPTPGRGMPLGIEPSQQEMVALPSSIDNYIKCQLGIHVMGHYMDDYYIALPDIEELKKVAREIVRRFEAMGIRVSKRKCKIIPFTKPFRFCKVRFTLTESGAVKRNGCRDGMKRSRRKLKFFQREVAAGRRTIAEAAEYMQSQRAYYRSFDDHGRLLRLERLAYAIFGGALCSKSSKTEPLLA